MLNVRRRKVENCRNGDPWVYPNACLEPLPTEAGFGQVCCDDGSVLGWADINPVAPVPARILSTADEWPGDEEFLAERIDQAIERRHRLGYQVSGGGVRLINAEGDGLPGLVVDCFGRSLVIDLYSLGMRRRLSVIRDILADRFADGELLVRMGEDAAKREGCEPIEPPFRTLEFAESAVVYQVLLNKGQKTGFFLDQRDNRRLVAGWARHGAKVLDLFSYHGAFSLAALGGGAASALAVDISQPALDQAKINAERNGHDLTVRQGNVFKILDDLGEQGPFDLVICDPPKLAPRKADKKKAMNAYRYLCDRCCRLLARGGVLMVASCSQAINAEDLIYLLRQLGAKHGWTLDVLAVTGQPSDHPWPVAFQTGRYLSAVSVSLR